LKVSQTVALDVVFAKPHLQFVKKDPIEQCQKQPFHRVLTQQGEHATCPKIEYRLAQSPTVAEVEPSSLEKNGVVLPQEHGPFGFASSR
jgi:hypothetical protein